MALHQGVGKEAEHVAQNLYEAQDEVDLRKEKLIEEIEARLQQLLERNVLFLIRWRIE